MGLFGDFDTSQPLWTADKVAFQQLANGSFSAQSHTTVGIRTAFGALPTQAAPTPTPVPVAQPTPGPVNAPPQARDDGARQREHTGVALFGEPLPDVGDPFGAGLHRLVTLPRRAGSRESRLRWTF